MSRRDRIEEETARRVEDRLHWLLTENGPEPVPSTGERAGRSQPRARPRRSRPDPRLRQGESAEEALAAPDADLLDADPAKTTRPARPASPASTRPARPARPATSHESDPATMRLPDQQASGRRPRSGPLGGGSSGPAALLASAGTFRRPHLVIVAAVVALALIIAGWAVLRARPVAVAVTPPAASTTAAGSTTGAGSTDSGGSVSAATPSPSAPAVVVHVLGAVRQPGLVSLTAGSRVQDAIDAAGGLTGKADPGELNLAQPVADGQQIVVGTKSKPSGEVRDGSGSSSGSTGGGSGSASGSGGAGSGTGQPVNLNTATQAQLEELPGVGPVMAGKIIAWRTEHGRFSRIEELQEIDGVGPKTYAKLAPLCSV